MYLAYFIVWANGEDHLYEIVQNLDNEKSCEPVIVQLLNFRSHNKIIKQVYNDDYSPRHHLKTKLKYLKQYQSYCFLIICRFNEVPRYEFVGSSQFRHIENIDINKIKQRVREKFNPRDQAGNLTHNHVIHAFDNQLSGSLFCKKFSPGFEKKINNRHKYDMNVGSLQSIELKKLYCHNFDQNEIIRKVSVSESIHFEFLAHRSRVYEDYIRSHLGRRIKYWHSPSKFEDLLETIDKKSSEIEPILVSKNNLILDGLHRAAIYMYLGYTKAKVRVLDD